MTCKVDGCPKARDGAHRLCGMHRSRLKTHGDLVTVRAPGPAPGSITGASHWSWKGDAVTKRAVHRRIDSARGKAREYICACGSRADEWAFDATTGYSTDLSRYTPMCYRCHKRHDFGRQ